VVACLLIAVTSTASSNSRAEGQAATYQGPRSGTLESSGGPIPQNAEYVFHGMPLVKLQLDYDQKIWDVKLLPENEKTQKLIFKNKGKGPQKKCVVHWRVIDP
jgi:hypothetical protein